MQIKVYTVDFQLSPNAKRAIRYALLPLAVFIGTAGIAYATVDTTWIAPGQPISSSKLTGVLTGLDTRVATVEAPVSARFESRTATQVLNSTAQVINFDWFSWDTASAVSNPTTSWRFTAPTAGKYLVQIKLSQAGTYPSTDVGGIVVGLYRNGSPLAEICRGLDHYTCQGSDVVQLTAGDYIQFKGTNSLINPGTLATAGNNVTVTRLGN